MDSVPTLDFTGIELSDIKKAEMLIKKSEGDSDKNDALHMSIIIQLSNSIKSISLT